MPLISCILCIICVTIRLAEASYYDDECPSEGSQASIQDFPFVVTLQQGYRHLCSGTIITSRWILTAASCILQIRDKNDLYALAGSSYVLRPSSVLLTGQQKRFPVYFRIHPGFDEVTLANDVGLTKVNKPFTYDSGINPIHIPEKWKIGRTPYEGKELAVPGWDFTSSEREDGHYVLAKCNVLVRRGEDCQGGENYKDAAWDKLFLCIYAENGVCFQEEAGAPLLLNSTLVGITSKHKPCSRELPVRHTRIDNYVDWIFESLNAAQTGRPHQKIIPILIVLSLYFTT